MWLVSVTKLKMSFLDKNFPFCIHIYRCNKICVEPLELTCSEHESEDDEEDVELSFYGKTCLLEYLKSNNNKCPLNKHGNCKYQVSLYAKRQILKSKIKCLNAMQHQQSN